MSLKRRLFILLNAAGFLFFCVVLFYQYANATTLTLTVLGNIALTSTTTGQANLESGMTEMLLTASSTLNMFWALSAASGGTIIIGGVSKTLSDFTSGDLSGIDMTVPKTIGGLSITVAKAVMMRSGIAGQPFDIKNSSLENFSVTFPDATSIMAQSGWDGEFVPPKTAAKSGTAPSGFSLGSTVIEVGSSDQVLLFDKPVAVVLAGVNGDVGYKPSGSSSWTRITGACSGTYASPSPPAFPGECYISNGTDTKIYTYHLTTFGSLNTVSASTETTQTTSLSGGGGGGIISGGGGGSAPSVPFQGGTNLKFKGRAYPFANLTILKDGSVLKTFSADAQGNYSVDAAALGGIYTFSIYSIDSQNRRSLTTSFTTNILADKITTFSDIVVTPTIAADKSQVKVGNDIQFFGFSYPQSQINVIINSEHEIYATTSSDQLGSWLYKINSDLLERGEHTIKNQTVTPDGMISPFSESLAFRVGDTDIAFGQIVRRPVSAAAPACNKNGDINNDKKVNIVDFSIMLFFWNQRSPSNPCADINADGQVNLFDFSIMLFWWSG